MKTPYDTIDKLWGTTSTRAEVEDVTEEEMPCSADELSLMNEVVPHPHEHHMQLGAELADVFETAILFLVHPGSGEMIKAALKQHKFALAICRTAAHKTLIMNNLRTYVKTMNLVSLSADAPMKDQEMIAYERTSLRTPTPTPKVMPKATPPPLPLPPQVAVEANVPTATVPTLASFGFTLL